MADAKQYPIGNYDRPGMGGHDPGIPAIQSAIKEGRAKFIDVYPETFNNGGVWDTRYWDKPTGTQLQSAGDWEGAGSMFGTPQPTKMLVMDGKVYPTSNNWGIKEIINPMRVIGYDKDSGDPLFSPESGKPSGMYNIYSRTGGGSNVFNNAVVGIDPSTGNFTGYSPQIYQDTRGSGGGGFGPLGGVLGEALNTIFTDAKNMAKETSNVWVPALSFGLNTGAISLGGTGGAGTGLLSSEAGALGAASDLAPAISDSSIYSLAPGASSGTGLQATIGEGTNLFSTGTNVGTDTLGTGLTLPDVPNLSSMGGGQGLTIPAAGGGLLSEAGVGNAVTAVTNPITGQPLGQELSNINTGVTDVTGTPTGTSTSNPLQNNTIKQLLGKLMADNTNLTSLGGGLLTGVGGAIQGQAAKEAAQQIADRMAAVTGSAVSGAQFRPVGITTRFGASNFQVNPQTGQLESAGYTPSALSEQLQQGAQGVYNLGKSYVAQSPQEAAANWMQAQQNLLAPARDVALSNLRNQVFQSGREGLSVAQGGNLQAANPEMAAYYNSLANQNALLASQAQQFGQQQAQFGTGLLGSGLQLMGGAESLAQQPFTMGSQLGQAASTAGARAGQLGIGGTQAGQKYLYNAASYSPFANLLSSAGQSQLGSQAVGNLLSQYAPQLGNWLTSFLAPTGGLTDLGNTVLNADNATNFWSY